ncbi:MAG: tetratricopeptide repeat protein [Acidipila sp.]|nr:tetratricopeptide repeat protein [Acidipila sp.]
MAQDHSSSILKFGVFEVNLSARELRKHGTRVRLPPQPFTILVLLLETPGEVVSREEMRQRLWATDTFVDFEHSLNSAIKKLRFALGDTPENSRYVETLPRVGYRFIAPVEEVPAKERSLVGAPPSTSHIEAPAITQESSRRRWSIILGIVIVLSAALGGYYLVHWSRKRPGPEPVNGRSMLAVLPFENLTGDAGQEYFSDGMTEEMIAQLGRLDPEHLGVIARTSMMNYKHSHEQLEKIGSELGVQYVLEGTVRRDADKVRISAQLIQIKDQTHIWARQYDRELSDLLALQGEIAQEIASGIQLTLGEHKPIAGSPRRSVSPSSNEAYDLYLKGEYFWNKRTAEGFQQAIRYFQQAVDKDPGYARAYAGLADSYALISGYSGTPQAAFPEKARAAAQRAVEIDESLPEAHTALALVVQNFDWDWPKAEREFRRAIELDPNYATAHHWYGEHLTWRGHFDEALQESERARQLDPLSLIIAADNGAILYYSRHYDRAERKLRSVLEMDPKFPRARGMLGATYLAQGKFAEALAVIVGEQQDYEAPWYLAFHVAVSGRAGQRAEAQRTLKILEQLIRHRRVDAGAMVNAYLGVNDKEQVFAWLEKAYAEHSGVITTLKVEPLYDPLASDPRFRELLHRVGLAP